jgi:hypothetical protein
VRDYRLWLALGTLLIAGRMLYPAFAGDRSPPLRDEDLQHIVFVCRDSGEAFVLRAKHSPEIHPRTGKPTLMPGLYCEQCQQWRASPPVDVLQRNPSASWCATHRVPMTNNGPNPPTLQKQ